MMDWLNAKGLHVVMDRGFYSEYNIDCLYSHGILFTVGVPFTTRWSRELVVKVREDIERFSNFHHVGGCKFFVITDTAFWKGQRCFRHVYYDSEKAALEYVRLLERVEVWRKELEENRFVEGNRQFYDRYFVVGVDSGGGRCVRVCDEAVLEFKRSVAGFFVLLSNDVSDAVEAFCVYREKDVVEKGFDDLKNGLDLYRLRVHGAEAMDGRLFIAFVSQILSSAVRKVMSVSKLDEKYTLPELMNELKSIHSVYLEGQRKTVFSKLSKAQREIFTAFNIDEKTYV